jgi:Uma2 family endonuclease
MTTSLRWTSRDLEALPDDGKRYEIIEGELHVSRQPHWYHQYVSGRIFAVLQAGCERAGHANLAPGLIFAEDDDVAPDVVWISNARLAAALGVDGKLHAAPELVVEVLSPGAPDGHRDRELKRKLYSRRGVLEYWIVDWQLRQITVYRREQAQLALAATLFESDTLETPLLADFSCPVARLFEGIPQLS